MDVTVAPRRSPRDLAAFAFAALLAAAGAAVVARAAASPGAALVALAAVAVAALVSAIDIRTRRAPNAIVYPALAVLLAGSSALGTAAFISGALGAALAFVLLLLVALAGRGAMGFGDVKFGAIVGAAVGPGGVLPALLTAFVAGGAWAALLLLLRLRGREDATPFTPFLASGLLVAFLFFPGYLLE